MADKPSRALVLIGDGLARFISPSHTHLHTLASLACCGFLTLPHSSSQENEGQRITREFAELLDACDADHENKREFIGEKSDTNPVTATIPQRFMGMKAALLTQNSELRCFSDKLGLTTLPLNELIDDSSTSLSVSQLLASELLKLLGFEEGKISETSKFDIIFVHVGAGEEPNGLLNTEQMNDLVGALLHFAHPGTEISTRLHLSILMSYGAISGNETSDLSLSIGKDEESNPELSRLIPRQSYTMKGGKPRTNVRLENPILIAQWQNGVTRKDMVETYSFAAFKEHCGNLVSPADRFLHEVAFKLWKAPKYGA